ncbi:glycoside hydrolase family 6 protein [Pseudomonas sp. CGJS7]|uniref:glycoside hydrolase family 6 protein n=1 Tax=Pseudomonas sp. CGJS7 TaxID=3109348 RepID=UPI0030091FFD
MTSKFRTPRALLACALATLCAAPALAADSFLGDPDNVAARWVRDNPRHPQRAQIAQRIVAQPMARWVGGGNIRDWVAAYTGEAARQGKIPILVAYNIPQRDCGQWSQGGEANAAAYRRWLREQWVPALGQGTVAVILEPDALIHLTPGCLGQEGMASRLDLLGEAVDLMKQQAPNAHVYLDGGDGRWNGADIMVPRLVAANIQNARGFAINVSNYNSTADAVAMAERMRAMLADQYGIHSHYVIDTSRNGASQYDGREWCNPGGRRLGPVPRLGGAGDSFDALLWIKTPGASDGNCGIGKGTTSGVFYPSLAGELMK